MRAMVMTGFGDPQVFEERELPTPEPGIGELRVRVLATSVNPVDCKIRRSGGWAGITPPAVIGYDVAGVVDAVGPGVKDFAVGDEVFYTPVIFGGSGSYAEYHIAHEAIVTRKPQNLTFLEAASLPLAGCTAWDAIVTRARVQPGETVLVHAGAGGVGSLAIQLSKIAGARVLATASTANAGVLRSLGTDVAIDYRSEDFVSVVSRETAGLGVHVVLDTVGGETLARSIAATRPHGRLVSIVSTDGAFGGAYIKNLTVYFLFMERARHKVKALRTLAERGQLHPVIDSVMPLRDVAAAHTRLERGGVRGKIVLKVADETTGAPKAPR